MGNSIFASKLDEMEDSIFAPKLNEMGNGIFAPKKLESNSKKSPSNYAFPHQSRMNYSFGPKQRDVMASLDGENSAQNSLNLGLAKGSSINLEKFISSKLQNSSDSKLEKSPVRGAGLTGEFKFPEVPHKLVRSRS